MRRLFLYVCLAAAMIQANNHELAAAKSKLAGYHRKQMDENSYRIVSHLLHDTTVFHRDTFRTWLGNLDTYGARISLAGDYWSAGDTSSAKAVLQNIPNQYDLTAAEEADYNKVKYLFGRLYGKNIYNLSQNIIDELEVFAADSAGYATGIAQTILRLYGRDYPPIGYLPGEERGQKQGDKKAAKTTLIKQGVRVYPNPATDHVIFDFQGLTDKANARIEINDLSGRLVWSRSAPENSESIVVWNTADVRPGVYFFRIVTGKDVRTGKISLQK